MAPFAPFLFSVPRVINTEDLNERIQEGRASRPFAFSGFEFQKPLNLSGISFESGVEFRRCIFLESVDFSGAQFRGYARFWKCVFKKTADFKYAVFKKLDTGAMDSAENGEANFSWSRFEGDADFLWAQFEGPAFFWRTIFENFAKLEATLDPPQCLKAIPAWFASSGETWAAMPGCLMDCIRLACFSRTTKIPIAQWCLRFVTKKHSKKNSKLRVSMQTASIKSDPSFAGYRLACFVLLVHLSAVAHFEEPESITFRNINVQLVS